LSFLDGGCSKPHARRVDSHGRLGVDMPPGPYGSGDFGRAEAGGRGENHRVDLGADHELRRPFAVKQSAGESPAAGGGERRCRGVELIGKAVSQRRDHDACISGDRLQRRPDASATAAHEAHSDPVAPGRKRASGDRGRGGQCDRAFEERTAVDGGGGG
jgi:hypothetical protein